MSSIMYQDLEVTAMGSEQGSTTFKLHKPCGYTSQKFIFHSNGSIGNANIPGLVITLCESSSETKLDVVEWAGYTSQMWYLEDGYIKNKHNGAVWTVVGDQIIPKKPINSPSQKFSIFPIRFLGPSGDKSITVMSKDEKAMVGLSPDANYTSQQWMYTPAGSLRTNLHHEDLDYVLTSSGTHYCVQPDAGLPSQRFKVDSGVITNKLTNSKVGTDNDSCNLSMVNEDKEGFHTQFQIS